MHQAKRTGPVAGAWLIAALALALGGCGSGSGPAAGGGGGSNVARKAGSHAADGLSPGMVAGVTPPGAGPQSVQVKFELRAKPEVAQPLDVDVVIVPVYGNLDRISGKIVGDDGLEMLSGQELPATEKPVEGTAIHHSVQVKPKRDGIFTLSAVLLVDSAGQSTSQMFSIPVIAGAGEAEAPAGTPSAAAGASGTPASPSAKSGRPGSPPAAAQ